MTASRSLARTEEQLEQEIQAWRRARVARLTAPDSWLSLIGKHWLVEGENRAGSRADALIQLPEDRSPADFGTFELRDGKVLFTPAKGSDITLREAAGKQERAVAGPITLTTDQRGEPDKLLYGSLSLEVMERAGAFAVRTRDSEAPGRVNFPGIDYFPIDPALRIVARFEPYAPEKSVPLAYETGNAEEQFAPGLASFDIDGISYRVDPVRDGPRARLFLLFWDQTCRSESYGAGRFLYTPLPDGDTLLLDFNQAFSPPCAFTPHAACPLPPPQNRLQVAIRAGEKRPR